MTDIGESINTFLGKLDKPCGIKTLNVECSHGRKCKWGVLQIVADQTKTVSLGKDGVDKPDGKEAWKQTLEWITGEKSNEQEEKKEYKDEKKLDFKLDKQYAGKDEITVEAITWDGNGPKKVCCQDKDTDPDSWKSSSQKFEIPAPPRPAPPSFNPALTEEGDPAIEYIPAEEGFYSLKEIWPINVEPDRYYVYGRGCTETYRLVTVENYPNQQYKVEISLEFISAFVNKVNDSFKGLGDKYFNATPFDMTLELNSPKGVGKGEWGWKEETDSWKTAFNVDITLGFEPLLGIKFAFEVSMLAVAGAYYGIPPALSKFLGKCLVDIIITFSASCDANLTGSPKGKFYSDGDWSVEGSAVFAVVVIFKLEVKGRIGSDYILSASLTVGGEIKFNNKIEGELSSEGLFIQPKIEMDPPLKVEVVVMTRAFKFFKKEKKLGTWEPFGSDPLPIYEGKRMKLFPQEPKTGGGGSW